MRGWYHSWRAALRIARRDAWRSKGRSFLVLAMIALPIVGVSAADVTVRTSQLSVSDKLDRSIGAADARLKDDGYGGAAILQNPEGDNSITAEDFDDQPYPDGKADLDAALPPGARVLKDATGSAKVRTAHGSLHVELRELTATDPMAEGMLTKLDGRFPDRDDEVAVTSHFLAESGLSLGSKLTFRGLDRPYLITGVYELPGALDTSQVNALPGAVSKPLDTALAAGGLSGTGTSATYLVTVPGGFTWNMVEHANTKGVAVQSRAVLLDPPARSEVKMFQHPDYVDYGSSSEAGTALLASLATVVGLAMLEICLLAGPAFAVGARRSRRQLGLVGANGGDRRHIRSIVLAGGLVIGAAAAVVGTVLGVALTFALRPWLEDWLGQRFGGFDLRPLELLAIALVAVVTGLLAAIVPAVTASRQTVLASLTGRRGVRRASRVLPVIGLVAVVLGAAIALYGSVVSDQFVIVAGGSALAELGVVALTPALVGLFGRAGRWLPLSPRLALRDAVRNRGRTAPAVAAVLAAVAGTVAVATYQVSDEAQQRAAYDAQLPHGAVSALLAEGDGREAGALRDAVRKDLPVDVTADVGRITVGRAGCGMYSDAEGCGYAEVVVPKANECPLWKIGPDGSTASDAMAPAERRRLARDWRCASRSGGVTDTGLVVGDAALLKVLKIDDPAAERALAAGKAVSFYRPNVDEREQISIRQVTDRKAAEEASRAEKPAPGTVVALPAYQAPAGTESYGLDGIVPPAAAKAAGLATAPIGAYYSTDTMPSSPQRQKLDQDVDQIGAEVMLHVEEGFTGEKSIVLLALTVFAGLITIGAAGIATGLAQADAEGDLKTLAAVGAPPRVRRTLSGFQCGVVALMGVVLGSAAGLLPGVGLRFTERRSEEQWYQQLLDQGGTADAPFVPVVIPWQTLAALLVLVPLGAALLAALVTRSRGALARREAD
ncbi:ABC transporter permease [Streptomyces solincola]|uniref:ABC transporter permease n=1 Tax=Streptomyces solincola TaxID=2100817 RepID=A0A2S9PY31_9ACTN|nr:ABC transporter permease [Streptomyces solincola]PRH79315.1 ABC transporter permease [Streptomyces solincola]